MLTNCLSLPCSIGSIWLSITMLLTREYFTFAYLFLCESNVWNYGALLCHVCHVSPRKLKHKPRSRLSSLRAVCAATQSGFITSLYFSPRGCNLYCNAHIIISYQFYIEKEKNSCICVWWETR